MKPTLQQRCRSYQKGVLGEPEFFHFLDEQVVSNGADAVLFELPAQVADEYRDYLLLVRERIRTVTPGVFVFLGSNMSKERNDHLCALALTALPLVQAWFDKNRPGAC